MFEIITSNYLLWINIAIPFAIGIYFALTHQEYTAKEFAIQAGITSIVLFIMFSIGYVSQDISTTSYNSGKVNKIVYEEEWTELVHYTEQVCSGSGKTRSCHTVYKTRRDHHPDEYYLVHDFGTSYISEGQWNKSKNEFGYNQTDDGHMGQVSYGDGRTWEANPNKIIPVASTDTSINYVYAAKTNIIKSSKFKDLEKRYQKELVKYPEMYEDEYGNTNFRRVINGHLVSPDIHEMLNLQLEEYASLKGSVKEVNPIIYFTTAEDREFTAVVKGFYRDAHKNDAVLVVSVTNGEINWIDSFGFTKNAEFFVANRSIEQDVSKDTFKSVSNAENFVARFTYNITQHWKRTPMEEYKYLAGDIDLPLWFEIMTVLLNVVGSFLAFRFMFNNRI
jgi:hypothetical protein